MKNEILANDSTINIFGKSRSCILCIIVSISTGIVFQILSWIPVYAAMQYNILLYKLLF